MGVLKDLTGQRFGKLSVVSRAENVKIENSPSRPAWNCVCECGTEKIVSGSALKNGYAVSCGCYRRETTAQNTSTHGLSSAGEYNVWLLMRSRCNKKKNKNYPDYGGRGITVCERWSNSFENFIQDMGTKPTKFHTLDRINNDKGYSPENCRWATRKTQSMNRRGIRYINAFGQNLPVFEWAKLQGIRTKTILARIDRLHWSEERAITEKTNAWRT